MSGEKERKQPTEPEWNQACERLAGGFREVVFREFTALLKDGFDPYSFRYCAMAAHFTGVGHLIGANSDPEDRARMLEFIHTEGYKLAGEVADAVLLQSKQTDERPN